MHLRTGGEWTNQSYSFHEKMQGDIYVCWMALQVGAGNGWVPQFPYMKLELIPQHFSLPPGLGIKENKELIQAVFWCSREVRVAANPSFRRTPISHPERFCFAEIHSAIPVLQKNVILGICTRNVGVLSEKFAGENT